jgi:hypothetical protein
VFAINPVIELVNAPVPEPSLVQVLAVVGLAEALQQTPRAVTDAPPSEVTSPPPAAVVCVIDVIAAVDTVGKAKFKVVKATSAP